MVSLAPAFLMSLALAHFTCLPADSAELKEDLQMSQATDIPMSEDSAGRIPLAYGDGGGHSGGEGNPDPPGSDPPDPDPKGPPGKSGIA